MGFHEAFSKLVRWYELGRAEFLPVLFCQENKSRQIRQFHFHGWPEVGIPSDGKGMINIIAAVQKQQQQSGNHPITVHCR